MDIYLVGGADCGSYVSQQCYPGPPGRFLPPEWWSGDADAVVDGKPIAADTIGSAAWYKYRRTKIE